MAFDPKLASRVRAALSGLAGITEKRMFGGIAFMRDGAMLIGVDKDDLIVRCAKEDTDVLLKRTGVREFDLSGGRPMRGWLLVGQSATRTDRGFQAWIAFSLAGSNGTRAKESALG
jgi:TfoX/Sxy family transcriptional regulator of competence genes